MDRRQLLLGVGAVVAGTIAQGEATPGEPIFDLWEGAYQKFAQFAQKKIELYEAVPTVTIRKIEDKYYTLEPLYSGRKFTEIEKGVLSDGVGGIGKLFFGKLEFAGRTKAVFLKADFCYEDFILYREYADPAK